MKLVKEPTTVLKLDWATHAQAEYACRRWHYSQKVPKSKIVKIGVWENGSFIGVVLFSMGANNNIGKPYGLTAIEVCELTRIALNTHITPVSKIISIAMKFLSKQSPGLKLIVSYADKLQGHHGGIYQAGNWIYCGEIKPDSRIILFGEFTHRRTLSQRYNTCSFEWIRDNVDPHAKIIFDKGKHKYLMPLDRDVRKALSPLSLPYPKRIALEAEESMHSISN